MNHAKSLFAGFGAGVGLMYLLDPARGKRRRALIRDKFASGFIQSRYGMEKTWRDLEHRAHGVTAGLRALVSCPPTDDDVLVARVRSRIGRLVSHPHAITVRSESGRIILEGPVLSQEVQRLVSSVAAVPGVNDVESRLEVHQTAENVPALQGGSFRPGHRSELLQTNWTPAIRMLVGLTGGSLVLNGLIKGGFTGFTERLLGAGLLLRAVTNKEMRRIFGMDHGHFAVDIQKALNIHAPVEEVYKFWTNYQNLPRIMTHLREVRDLGNGRLHWTAAGPAGVPVSWETTITENVPNKLVAWRSVPGSQIENSGQVRFDPNPDGGTRITIRMSYNPPAGMFGHVVASLFGADPKREIDEDLVRLKSLFEYGKTRAHGETVRREQMGSVGQT